MKPNKPNLHNHHTLVCIFIIKINDFILYFARTQLPKQLLLAHDEEARAYDSCGKVANIWIDNVDLHYLVSTPSLSWKKLCLFIGLDLLRSFAFFDPTNLEKEN